MYNASSIVFQLTLSEDNSDEKPRIPIINIRNEDATDVDSIRALTEAAFKHTPHSDHTEHLIIDALRRAGQLSVSLVAETDGLIVGHVAVSPVSISDGSRGWYGLGPISVSPRHQGTGIGSQLMKQALSALKQRGAQGCVLLGDPGYYSRFGFKTDKRMRFPDVPAEYFQILSFSDDVPEGDVTYHESFYGIQG